LLSAGRETIAFETDRDEFRSAAVIVVFPSLTV
jgi:hypothetical protein